MIRWIWYANLVLLALAVVLAGAALMQVIRPAQLPVPDHRDAPNADQRTDTSSEQTHSPLIAAARRFARRWEPPAGSVTVAIEPAEVRESARWRVGSGEWLESGQTAEDVPVAAQRVIFQPVPGWHTPAPLDVTVVRDQTAELTATYTPPLPTGSVQVAVSPEAAVEAGAQWRIDDGPWQGPDAIQEDVPVGDHAIELKPLTLWAPPESGALTVAEDQLTSYTATYTAKPTGSLTVGFEPDEVAARARWRVGEGPWQELHARLDNLLVGEYSVEFQSVEGWRPPESVTVAIAEDELTQVLAAYEKIPTGSLVVHLNPESLPGQAQWRIAGRPWQSSGESVADLLMGDYQVEFQPVDGWTTPEAQSATITANEQTELTAEYGRIKPPPPNVAVDTTIVVSSGYGFAWLRVPGQPQLQLVGIGDAVGEYRVQRVGDGWVEFERDGFLYRQDVPQPESRTDAGPGGAFHPHEKTDKPPAPTRPLPRDPDRPERPELPGRPTPPRLPERPTPPGR